jgi:hypothetical protein
MAGLPASVGTSIEEQAMCARAVIATAAALAVTVAGGVTMPPARAFVEDLPINGTFIARSMGEWAKTNERYQNEATVTSTWTITSTCSDAFTCTGTVTSDLGWTAQLERIANVWVVHRELPAWEPCADGTNSPGHQAIRFWGVDDNGMVLLRQSEAIQFAGIDRTVGDSGACGINQWLAISMPFTMRKIA